MDIRKSTGRAYAEERNDHAAQDIHYSGVADDTAVRGKNPALRGEGEDQREDRNWLDVGSYSTGVAEGLTWVDPVGEDIRKEEH